MSKTEDNLKAAFAGESQANHRYLFFADKADQDGLKHVARLFRAAADAETVHARMHFRVLNGVGTTAENLATAIGGEYHEFTEMYPDFLKQAEQENEKQAVRVFDFANQVEKIHHGLFQQALADANQGKVVDDGPIFVCQVCGNTVEGEVPDKCPICGAPKSRFNLID